MKDINKSKHIVTPEGFNIYYWVNWSKDMKKPFVFLHSGSSTNHSTLEDLEKQFNNANHPTISLDFRGVGYSRITPKEENFTLNSYSQDIEKILLQEGIEKPFMLGQSFGFMPVVDYVSRTNNSDRIIGLCSSHNFSQTTANKMLFHLFDKVLRYNEYAGSLAMNYFHKLKKEKRNVPDQTRNTIHNDFQFWLQIVDVPFNEIKGHIVAGKRINKWNITEQLKKLDENINMHLIYGSNDLMVMPYAGNQIQQRTNAKCTTDIIMGKHSLPTFYPEKTFQTINKYLVKK